MKRKKPSKRDEMRSEYTFDYSKAVRGKYYRRLLKEGANVKAIRPHNVEHQTHRFGQRKRATHD